MGWIKTVLSEFVSLFVEDGSLALAIIVWLALFSFLITRFDGVSTWRGAILFAGLAVILVENTWRRAKRGG